MNFSRLKILSNEIDFLNAISRNEKLSINTLFADIKEEDLTVDYKLNKLCSIAYKSINSFELENEDILKDMFNELCENTSAGEFCIEYLKFNLNHSEFTKEEKLNKLKGLDYMSIPDSQIKQDFLDQLITLLLEQDNLDIEELNRYNEELKRLINADNEEINE